MSATGSVLHEANPRISPKSAGCLDLYPYGGLLPGPRVRGDGETMEMVNRVIVAGGRDFTDYALMCDKLEKILSRLPGEIEIISGCARGADQLGERYGAEHGLHVVFFPADWDKYGKRAGFIRNQEMAAAATHCVVFWDGESRGSGHMINIARERGIPLRVIRYVK